MRVALFFDGKNYYSGQRVAAEGKIIDFLKLSEWLVKKVGGSQLWGAYYYTGIETGDLANTEPQRGLVRFLDGLELLTGFFVHRFPRKARRRRCEKCRQINHYSEEKQVDTTMVADMLRLAAVNAFDVAVLVSGDEDHTPAVAGVRAIGKQVYVATWGKAGLSQRLRKAAFDHIDLVLGLPDFLASSKPPVGAQPHEASLFAEDSAAATDADTEAVFLEELAKAESHFKEGYVGVNYFLKNWKSSTLKEDFQARNRILTKLVDKGEIELYSASDGNKALRIVSLPDAR